MFRSPLKNVARFIIGLLLIAVLLYRFNPEVVFSTIISASVGYILLAVMVYAITFSILSIRWRTILRSMGKNIKFLSAYQAFANSMIISDLTPGRIGEFSRPFLVRDKVDLGRGIASVAVDRYADILTILILGLSGMVLWVQDGIYLILACLTILSIVIFSLAFWFKRHLIINRIGRLGSSRISRFFCGLDEALNEVTDIRSLMVKSVLLTAVAWITHALRIVLIAKSIGYDAPMMMLFFFQPLISALAIIPLTISGLGLVEGGLAALLTGLGIPIAAGISIALLDRIITVAFHILVGGRCAMKF